MQKKHPGNLIPIHVKDLHQTRNRKKLPQVNKGHLTKTTANIFNAERLKTFALKIKFKKGHAD